MIRLSKLSDYGILLMSRFATVGPDVVLTARELAERSGVSLPTVSKLLKVLHRAELLLSQRGVNGGYRLSRSPHSISITDIIAAIDGPVTITECSKVGHMHKCDLEVECPLRGHWMKINAVVVQSLSALTLQDMVMPVSALLTDRIAPKHDNALSILGCGIGGAMQARIT